MHSYISYQIHFRVNEVEREGRSIIGVDGSFVYRKYKSLTESGVQVERPVKKTTINLSLHPFLQFTSGCWSRQH